MYTKEQVKEIVEYRTGQKVERLHFKNNVVPILADVGQRIIVNDDKKVNFILGIEYSLSVLGEALNAGYAHPGLLEIAQLDGVVIEIPITLFSLYPTNHESFNVGGIIASQIRFDGISTIDSEEYRGFINVVYYECILSN